MESKDIKKTEVKRQYSRKRAKGRKKKLSTILYFFLILILAFAVFICLSMTVMFNVKKIEVVGNVSNYTPERIIEESGIEVMDNMVKLDSSAVERRLVENLTYIESAKIIKKFPDTIRIEVTKCQEAFNVEYDEGILYVSENGKILSKGTEANSEYVTLKGFEPSVTDEGRVLKSKDEQKDEIFSAVAEALSEGTEVKIDSIDVTNKYSITIQFDSRIIFDAGTRNDIDYKLQLAESAILDLEDDAKGYLTMVGNNQVSFRTAKAVNNTQLRISQSQVEGTTEETTESDDDLGQ